MTRSEFMQDCRDRGTNILDALLALPRTDGVLRDFLSLGVTAAEKNERSWARKMVKQGRSEEIRNPLLREDAETAVKQWSATEFEITNAFNNKINSIVSDFKAEYEKSIFAKWIVAGIPLGEATPEFLRGVAVDEDARADGHAKNAVFYRSLADLGRPGVSVGSIIPFERAERLRESIFETNAEDIAA